jgi:hypothetical protein
VSTQTTTEKRKVARIVFDRPPLKKGTFLLFLLAGALLGWLVALLMSALYYGLGDATPNFPAILMTTECVRWYFVLIFLGALGGACIGWGYKREVTAHVEMVEQQTMQRRRSGSTAMVRVDYGRRW